MHFYAMLLCYKQYSTKSSTRTKKKTPVNMNLKFKLNVQSHYYNNL